MCHALDEAQVLLEAGDFQQAMSKVNASLLRRADDPGALFIRGKLQLRMGNYSAALSDLLKVTDLSPDHREAQVMADMIRSIFSFKDPNLFNP